MSDTVKENELLENLRKLLINSVNKSHYIIEYNNSIGNPITIKIPPEMVTSNMFLKTTIMTMEDINSIVQLVTEYIGKDK